MRRDLTWIGLALVVTVLVILGGVAHASPPVLWEPARCLPGMAAGQCEQPRGVAGSPNTGRVFVGDSLNNRIVEFDPLGEFVKAWGWDVVAEGPGDDVVAPDDQFEICVPEDGDVCKAGVPGDAAGQLGAGINDLVGLEVDAVGDIHVVDRSNLRVQKFSPSGEFLLMYGGEVNKTTLADVCTAADIEGGAECGAGTSGPAPGEFGAWAEGDFIARGADARIYVGDVGRIQRFGADGVYQAECGTVAEGVGNVQSLAADDSGGLYVIANGGAAARKLSFVAGGECEASTSYLVPPPSTAPISVAVDASGQVYAFSNPASSAGVELDRIFVFDQAGAVIDQFGKGEFLNITSGSSLATNLCMGSEPPGNLYVTTRRFALLPSRRENFVRAYGTEPTGCFKARTLPATEVEETSATLNGTVNPSGSLSEDCRFEWGETTAYGNVVECAEDEATVIGEGEDPVPAHADLTGLQGATVYHFRLRAKVNGETEAGPDLQFKTKGPPTISGEHLAKAAEGEAIVRALVNPEGFSTDCRVQLGTGGAFDRSTPASSVGEDREEHTVNVVVEGLEPGTTYGWRFVCENSALHDGGLTTGEGGSLTTYRPPAPDRDCPNQTLRSGYSATLPDCRAYEMVSPVDKNGADIVGGPGLEGGGVAGFAQTATSGKKITYAAKFPAFADPDNSFAFNQYLAERVERGQLGEGWSNEAIHPPYEGEPPSSAIPVGISRDFTAFTDDLCSAWLADFQTPPLNPDGQEKAANLYRRDNCDPGTGDFETLTDVALPLEGEARSHYVNRNSVQGHSADGAHAVLVAEAKLTPDANEGTNAQLYERSEGALRLVSVKPDSSADAGQGAVGSGWFGSLEHAVSVDGSRVYWTSRSSTAATVGQLYLRLQDKGETIEVSTELDGGFPFAPTDDAFFWAASPDGSKALYSERESLYLFELLDGAPTPSGESTLLAGGVMGVVGASDDLSRVYFVSRESLDEGAAEGQPNLYLAEGGGFELIGTLAEGDVGQLEPGADTGAIPYDLISRNTLRRASRVNPDGSAIAFNSRAPLTGFDNTTEEGAAAVEVFLYDAVAGKLLCVSCNPSGARPQARELPEPYLRPGRGRVTKAQAAAWIPTWEHPTHASHVLSNDAKRLFFNSNDALLPGDTNGAQDVYQWEAPGSGGCDTGGANYFAARGGCIDLISSGDSPFESTFWEASPDGDDVFFTTESGLLPQDPGSVDLYDARVGGGFPQPAEDAECEGEACQSPPAPPEFPAPASGAYRGPGNETALRDCRTSVRRAVRLSRKAKAARRGLRKARRQGSSRAAVRMARQARRFARVARKQSRNAKRCRRANRRAAQ